MLQGDCGASGERGILLGYMEVCTPMVLNLFAKGSKIQTYLQLCWRAALKTF